jgi:hypothetical protein
LRREAHSELLEQKALNIRLLIHADGPGAADALARMGVDAEMAGYAAPFLR